MDKKYHILWVDDQYEELKSFIIDAENNGIILTGYKSFEEAFVEIEKDLSKYDGILLDGMFFDTKEQVAGTEDEKGIGSAIAKINQLKYKKAFPWFVLSGKDQFTKEQNPIITANKKRCFDKTNGEDIKVLFEEIKKEADGLEDTQLKHKHSEVFEICTEKYIGSYSAKNLLSILKNAENILSFNDPDIYFNPLRKIVEDFFRFCNKFGLLPDEFVTGSVSINESSKFFSHIPVKGFSIIKSDFPDSNISSNIKNVINLCQEASHRGKIDELYQKTKASYLLFSITFQFLSVLVWFKNYVDENPNIEENKKLYIYNPDPSIPEPVIGTIQKDDEGNFFCDNIMLLYTLVNKGFKVGDKIKITEIKNNTEPRTKDKYPKFSKNFVKLK